MRTRKSRSRLRFINEIVKEVGKEKLAVNLYTIPEDINLAVREYADKLVDEALAETDRQERQKKQDAVDEKVLEHFADIYPDNAREIKDVIYYVTKEKVRAKILNEGFRPDGEK